MYKKGSKEYDKEVYLVKYGFRDDLRDPAILRSQLNVTKDSLKASTKGYTSIINYPGVYSNREFVFIEERDRKGIIVELVYPYNAVMPETFLDDILDRFPPEFLPHKESSEDIKTICDNLIIYGWNPRLSIEKPWSSMNIKGQGQGSDGRDLYFSISLPSFLMQMFSNSMKSKGIDSGLIQIEFYRDWCNQVQTEHPEFSLQNWLNQKETFFSWEDIN